MNLFGIGGAELIIILVLMLIVAGPKRMIAWAYVLGTYIAKLRAMWAETSKYLQQEFDNAGVDIQVPKDLPTRANITREIGRAISPVTKPIQDALDEVDSDVKSVRRLATPTPNAAVRREPAAKTAASTNGNGQAAAQTPTAPASPATPPAPPAPPSNPDSSQGFGAWGGSGKTEG